MLLTYFAELKTPNVNSTYIYMSVTAATPLTKKDVGWNAEMQKAESRIQGNKVLGGFACGSTYFPMSCHVNPSFSLYTPQTWGFDNLLLPSVCGGFWMRIVVAWHRRGRLYLPRVCL